jgi:hypothetical protein
MLEALKQLNRIRLRLRAEAHFASGSGSSAGSSSIGGNVIPARAICASKSVFRFQDDSSAKRIFSAASVAQD